MLFIQKKSEPKCLTEYRLTTYAHYDNIETQTKDIVKDSLMNEQGYLCAYCMKRIGDRKDARIEHFLPRNPNGPSDAELTLEYRNMLAVCYGNQKSSGVPYKFLTCDAHRKNQSLTINPLVRISVDKIEYRDDGKIFSNDLQIEKDLNITLNLNCSNASLPESRKSALDALKVNLIQQKKLGKWNQGMIQRYINHYSETKEGRYGEFAGILLWYLKKKLH